MEECLPELHNHLQAAPLAALKAPPGSGKTILCPAALLEMGNYDKVYVLEPRRVTARLPALALREVLGDVVGYRIRLESLWDAVRTRLGYLTYGTALRLFLSSTPGPRDLVIFDEFHERSWEAEVLLAVLRANHRGAKILLMSATLDLLSLPGNLPVVESDGRLHKVQVSWEVKESQLTQDRRRLADLVAERSKEWAIRERREQLIFLPGLAHIRAVEERLRVDSVSGPVDILHSSLPESEIRRVVERSPSQGFRRILSTDLAESSVTLPGIGVVLDAGLVRRPVRDQLDLGVTLKTWGAPKSSLEQRAGRAGRLGPGFCHRLFTRAAELHRAEHPVPQLEQADYRTVTLFLSSAELLHKVQQLPWLYPPCSTKLDLSRDWCLQQDLIDDDARLTLRGEQVLGQSLEPRHANFALCALEMGIEKERVIKLCLSLCQGSPTRQACPLETSVSKTRRDPRLEAQLRKSLPHSSPADFSRLEQALLVSHPDCVARLSGDRAVCALEDQPALEYESDTPAADRFCVILSTQPRGGSGPRSSVGLFHPVSKEQVWEALFDQLEEVERLEFSESSGVVKLWRDTKLGSLVIESESKDAPPGPSVAELLKGKVLDSDLPETFYNLSRRLSLYFHHTEAEASEKLPGLPDGGTLQERLLAAYLLTTNRWSRSSASDLTDFLQGLMPYPLRAELDRELPVAVNLPRRRRLVTVEYPEDGDPYIASKLQDFFHWEPPLLLGGRVRLLCHLLAPNGRACQITHDLNGFWSGSYTQVRKDLRGRYPKHDWPEDPRKQSN